MYNQIKLSQFQSTTTPKDGCNFVRSASEAFSFEFQSTTTPKDGCNEVPAPAPTLPYLFQSTTTPKDGCNDEAVLLAALREGFQSTTTPKDGCNLRPARGRNRLRVSIHNHPEGRLQHYRAGQVQRAPRVSIHNHPEGRLQLSCQRGPPCSVLVSIHNHPEGRLQRRGPVWRRLDDGFQSTTTPKDGCNIGEGASRERATGVSIHNHPEGRLQRPAPALPAGVLDEWFQSTTTPKDGCNVYLIRQQRREQLVSIHNHPEGRLQRVQRYASASGAGVSIHNHPEGRLQLGGHDNPVKTERFQSTTTPKDGCNACACTASIPRRRGFNPQPPRRTAATGRGRLHRPAFSVSIHNHPEGRLQREDGPAWGRRNLVSIHNHPEGRLQLQLAKREQRLVVVSIHNHPEGRLQPPVGWLLAFRDFLFQSTTTPKDGCNPLPADARARSFVSIHNHPEGRLQLASGRRVQAG